MDASSLIDSLTQLGLEWVESQRNLYREQGRALKPSERSWMTPFFSSAYLDAARLVWGASVEEPSFYAQIRNAGMTLIPFREMSAITYIDTIFFSKQATMENEPSPSLLFHELVHVVQYALLGTQHFLSRYVAGYFEHGQVYRAIPLEAHAYDLQREYEKSGTTMAFSVHARVENVRGAY